ncbi:uncharacterized protein LOC125459252 isoform X3 [Stegostoma tigrinum]|uniref:uncharacterized protein LOC125459252 isoform X3 n=1 Tax=Stegostoma tigrinum TaxID=3053191 RepID=UPI0028709106|nr:uncharacterized protein LOC125459252 isoform X3 [Stegostoma tigrinum]
MSLQLSLLAMSAALLQGCCFTSFSYFGSSFGLETSLVGDTIQVYVYYRGISLPCSQSLDQICVALNCTKSRTQIVGDNNHTAAWCLLDGEIIFHHNNTSLFYISPSGCCWSSLVGSQREAENLPFTFSLLADLRNRSDNVAINAPPQPPLLPVLRVPQNCTAKYNLTIYEKDGDILRCRYGQTARHECAHCTQLPFFKLDQENCILHYNGRGIYGTYSVELVIEDYPREATVLTHSDDTQTLHSAFEDTSSTAFNQSTKALSSIPMQFVIIVDRPLSQCAVGIFRPVFVHPTPPNGARIPASLYDEITFTISAISLNERITGFTIVGPHGLHKSEIWRVNGDKSVSTNVSWSVGVHDAPKQVAVCFVSITSSGLQSEPQCIWIVLSTGLHDEPSLVGPDLQCSTNAMFLTVPRSLVANLSESNLQLNDASCNITGNTTHLLVKIPLSGCGTKLLEDESHDIFTNKIISRNRNTTLAEREQVAIPVTCKFQRLNNGSKETNLLKSTTEKIFGDYSFEIQFSKQYNSSRRKAKVHAPFNATNKDLLYISIIVKSNVTTLSLYVESCQMSEYNTSAGITLLQQGCLNNSTTKEHQTGNSKEKVYSIKLSSLPHHPTQVFVTCNVQLCTNAYNSTSCSLGCGSDNSSQMEHSDMQQVSAGPIHIKKETDSDEGVRAQNMRLNGCIYSLDMAVTDSMRSCTMETIGLRG